MSSKQVAQDGISESAIIAPINYAASSFQLSIPLTGQPIYNTFFKRNSVFVTTVFLGAFAFSIGFDVVTSTWWDRHNRGVSSHKPLGSMLPVKAVTTFPGVSAISFLQKNDLSLLAVLCLAAPRGFDGQLIRVADRCRNNGRISEINTSNKVEVEHVEALEVSRRGFSGECTDREVALHALH